MYYLLRDSDISERGQRLVILYKNENLKSVYAHYLTELVSSVTTLKIFKEIDAENIAVKEV